jgi:hypothetical protein
MAWLNCTDRRLGVCQLLLCKYFVFIHLPRTGGTFIRETLAKHLPGNWEVIVNPGHATVHEIPAKYGTGTCRCIHGGA